jgi:hypothetical protein
MVSKKYWCTEVSHTYCGTSMTLWSSIRNLAYSYLALERGEARDMAKRCLSGQAVTIVIWWVIEQTSSSRVFFVLWDFFLNPMFSCEILLLYLWNYCWCARRVLPNARGVPPSDWSPRSPSHASGDSSPTTRRRIVGIMAMG